MILRDLDLIKSFPDARISWSINTLDEEFKDDMDKAVSIERRLKTMKAFHDAGIRTTCFISPIFPEITDVKAIIEQAKEHCNLIGLKTLICGADIRRLLWIILPRNTAACTSLSGDLQLLGIAGY